jgi:Flp pilus assembly protein TadG
MKHNHRFLGQNMIEFALVIPLLLLLIFGLFDLGRALFYYSSLANAVREGTRAGVVMPADTNGELTSAVQAKVLEYAFGLTTTTVPLTAEDIVVIITMAGDAKETLQITGNFCFVPVTPGVAALVGNACPGGGQGIPLTAVSLMHIEPGFK